MPRANPPGALLAILFLVGLDQFFKSWFLKNYPNLVIHNFGIAFDFFQHNNRVTLIYPLLYLIIALIIFGIQRRAGETFSLAWLYFFSGSLGNFYDRLVRGFVPDWLHLRFFLPFSLPADFDWLGAGNLADLLIVGGLVLFSARFFPLRKLKINQIYNNT